MKHFLALQLGAVALLGCLSVGWAETGAGVPLGMPDLSRARSFLEISKDNPQVTTIAMTSPPVTVLDSMVNFENYQIFNLDGETIEYTDGHPAIPHMTRLYRIPNTGSVDLVVSDAEYDVLNDVNVLPLQVNEDRFSRNLYKDPSIYNSDGWYPADPVVMSRPMIYRDFRVVRVTLFPVQVNPRLRQARVYHNLNAQIAANDRPGEAEILNPQRPSKDWAPLYRSQIANLDESALDEVTTLPGSYMILCRNSALPMQFADSLATWKRRAGHRVIVDARASWSQTAMLQAIQSTYNNNSPKLEYVCIIGDPSGSYSMPTGYSDYDHYYACMNSEDDLEDIAVGRLPGQSQTEFATMIAKIMAYERNPYMTDPGWFHRAFLYAGYSNEISSNEIVMLWARQQFYRFTGITTANISTHQGSVSNSLIAQRLNEGVSYFLWRGTVVGEMTTSAATGCNNGSKLPVVLTITCGSGDFDGGTCVSESWILAGSSTNLKGGVCGIGTATYGTHVQYNNTMAGGLIYNICNLQMQHLGPAFSGAKAQLYAAFIGGQASSFMRWNNLMGDPGLALWTQEPVVTNVTYPGTVNVGSRRIRPQVTNASNGQPIADALVVLWKGDECYATAFSDAFGFADVPVTINTPGIMTLTVTKQNHKPFLADIACVNAAEMAALSSYSMDDDNVGGTSGNANGILNPNETIDLPVYLRNFGTSQTATGITAALSTEDPWITILDGTKSYPNITVGDSARSLSPFRFSVSPTTPGRHDVNFTITATSASQTTHSTLRIKCYAGEATYISHQITGGSGDSWLLPGETANLRITLRNTGDLTLNSLSGTLISNSSFVQILSGPSSFGTINPNLQGSNTGSEFRVAAHNMAYRGYQAPMLLILTTGSGYVDSVTFNLPLGEAQSTDPTGPDAYGYFAYDNTDAAYEMSRPFRYINIASGLGTDLNIDDVGEQPPTASTYAVLRNLPFTFKFYGENYNQITVCSNGWAAFGDHHEQDPFRNYPIPGQQAPDGMMAVFWDDLKTSGTGQGVWDYFQADSHRYVIQWKGQGAFNTSPLDFEIVLLDPVYYPTRDGNGIIVYQYQQITESYGQTNDVPYSTVGIQAPGCTVGLQYRFHNAAEPGGATLVAGRSIVFTTESRTAFGRIHGIVTDAETQQPMPGVVITLQGRSDRDTTDAQGAYDLSSVLVGTYLVQAKRFGFNDAAVENVVVMMDSTIALNFAMLHPEIATSVDHINVTLPDNPPTTYFTLTNDGNGPLDYQISVSYAASVLDEEWSYLTGFDVSGVTEDQVIQGCELVGDNWWVTGGGGPEGQKRFYHFDLNGNYVNSIAQPTNDGLGWFDMAYDGQYIYGSAGNVIQGVNTAGALATTIPSPLNPTRALAYDPATDHFWIADYVSGIYEITRTGETVRHFNCAHAVTGLAWNSTDAQGYKLYIYGRDAGGQHAVVSRMHPVSGVQEWLINLDQQDGDRAGGCTVTAGWNSTLIVYAGILQNSGSDRLGIWELSFNTTWITVTPMFGSIAGGTSREVELAFDPAHLRNATYHVNLSITNNTSAGTVVLPVALTVNNLGTDPREVMPYEYRLEQNYPNPFNGQTTIRYELKQAGLTTLRIYNLLGQEVASVVNEMQTAGAHRVNFAMNDLASGVYVYRLESGDFRETRKMMLMK